MKAFLEKTIRQKISINKNEKVFNKLPLVYRGRYEIYNVSMNQTTWIIVKPKEEIGLVKLRKDRLVMEKATELNCALWFETTTYYIKEKLLNEGVPFVIKDKQVYLPFLGYLLSNEKEEAITLIVITPSSGAIEVFVPRCFVVVVVSQFRNQE